MRGDILKIKDEHRKAAQDALDILWPEIRAHQGKYAITVAGESGSGKSEVAAVLAEKLAQKGIEAAILQQDDYFVYPPLTNTKVRQKDISWVGTSEVRLDLLDQNLADILNGKEEIEKPLAIFQEDRFTTEVLKVDGAKAVIAEGTYTTLLQNVQCHIFIDRTYHETKAARLERAREEQDSFLEQVLKIEHDIISKHKANADIIIRSDYSVKKNERAGE